MFSLNKKLTVIIHKFKYLLKNEIYISDKIPIWVMIYNGTEKEPPIINACLKSIIENAGNHPVYILDKNNYSKYISLPSFILKKYREKIFNNFHFFEIIKFGILSEYEGYWIDSSYFITTPLSSINSSLFTLKLNSLKNNQEFDKYLWNNFIVTSKNSFLSIYVFNVILNYWKTFNYLIDSNLIDYIIYFAYKKEKLFKKIVDNIPFVNCDIFLLNSKLNNIFSKEIFNCSFNKLERIVNEKILENSTKTTYRYIIESNKFNFNEYKLKFNNRMNEHKKYDFGIIGLWYGLNFGSIATYFALHQIISKMGYSILMIANPLGSEKKKIYEKSNPYKFANLFYNISEKKRLNNLYEFNKECKGFIVGYDQLWNIGLSRRYKQMYFLGFVDDVSKKISYGTSFGKPYKGTKKEKEISISNLKRFNKISVRDKLSYDTCKYNFGLKEITQVCDPTLLCNLSDYEKLVNMSKVKEKEPYLLAYILDPNPNIGYRLENLSINKNLKIIIILAQPPKKFHKNRKKLGLTGKGNIKIKQNVDLLDWMWYFKHAKNVFTDSFHGTIFSIIFKKPFIALKNKKRGGERFISLLKPISLLYRLFDSENCITDNFYLLHKCQYDVPYKKLKKIQEKSYHWLENALKF